MTLIAGSLDGDGEWAEAASLARRIEEEMVQDELIDLDEEDVEATRSRRQTFVAMARAIVAHLRSNLSLTIEAGALGETGTLGALVPPTDKTLTGKVS